MRISTLGYSIKQGVKNIGRNKMFSIASMATMAACIFLFGVFFSIVINFRYIVDKAEEGYKGNTGLVTKYIPELEIKDIKNTAFVVVGPPIMMKFTVAEILKRGVAEENIWVSYERKMCCGLGKCGHCKMDDTYICLDGPVFNYTKAKNLVD